jgi:hypothetical protein
MSERYGMGKAGGRRQEQTAGEYRKQETGNGKTGNRKL